MRCDSLSRSQKYRISMERDFCLLMVLLTIPTAVVLSMCIGIGGCGWPNSWRMIRMIFASCALRKRAPSSASAADAATILRIVQLTRMAPFNQIGESSRGSVPRKKYPPARLHARFAAR